MMKYRVYVEVANTLHRANARVWLAQFFWWRDLLGLQYAEPHAAHHDQHAFGHTLDFKGWGTIL
jgi:hypothetical protein